MECGGKYEGFPLLITYRKIKKSLLTAVGRICLMAKEAIAIFRKTWSTAVRLSESVNEWIYIISLIDRNRKEIETAY